MHNITPHAKDIMMSVNITHRDTDRMKKAQKKKKKDKGTE